ncbi:MAG: hypothetical protein Q9174_000626 [Haloplaca sp. 1 TL-2023]
MSANSDCHGSEPHLEELILIDDIFKARAKDMAQKPLMAFPRSGMSSSDFQFFTGHDLDRFIEHSARHYSNVGIKANEHLRVSILGPTNIEWVVTCFGLLRAGFAVVTLSPRISAEAIANLMLATHCEVIIHTESPVPCRTVKEVKHQIDIQAIPMLQREGFDKPSADDQPFHRNVDKVRESERMVIIMHSSGSTGLPKPIYTSHKRYTVGLPSVGPGTKKFMTLPLYHSFPLSVTPWLMYNRQTVYFLNANVPLTHDNLAEAFDVAQPAVVYTVPYILKLLTESSQGVSLLQSCDQVVSVGSQCPQELGDYLVENRVNLGTWLGSTEVGAVGTSMDRDREDHDWAYLRISQSRMDNIWPKPVADGQFEFVYLEHYPSRMESNSDDPPKSFYSKDLFSPHPTKANAWKYLGRLDDRVTLTNGEKVLPLPIEGRIKRHPLVKENVVFGVARAIPGLLAFRADAAKDLSDADFVEAIWPDVEAANRVAEKFSQIGKDMIVPLPSGVEFPQADKGSIIRPQMYRVFEKEIDDAYARLDQQEEGDLRLDLAGLEKHLLKVGSEVLGTELESRTTDFFTAGMDSLGAIQMRGMIIRDLDLGGSSKRLSQNVVFETSNVESLAKHLEQLRHGHDALVNDWRIVMKGMIQKYSVFQRHSSGSVMFPKQHVVVLTGATGGLGAHLLSKLSLSPSVSQIYCLMRGVNPLFRLHKALQDRKLDYESSKTIALTADLSQSSLDLDSSTYSEIRSQATHIVHAAWPVNFQLSLSSFEPHVQGLHNLLQLSLSSPHSRPARLVFCSSVSAALGSPSPAQIPEQVIEDLEHASDMGYGRSKLVGEHIVAAAVEHAGAQATILRIGQVVGDTKYGMWNDREAIPSIVRSALTMGVLPDLKILCDWLPVDALADVVNELAGLGETGIIQGNGQEHEVKSNGITRPVSQQAGEIGNMELVYNVNSPHTFAWTSTFLPALRAAGVQFDTVPFGDWIQRLRSLSSDNSLDKPAAADPDKNPALKLLQYYESGFTDKDEHRDGRVEFDIEKAKRDSEALREAEDVVESGLVGKMVRWWMEKWQDSGKLETSDPAGPTEVNEEDDRGKETSKENVACQADQEVKLQNPDKSPENQDAEKRSQEKHDYDKTSLSDIKAQLKAELRAELEAAMKAEWKAEIVAAVKAEVMVEVRKELLGDAMDDIPQTNGGGGHEYKVKGMEKGDGVVEDRESNGVV